MAKFGKKFSNKWYLMTTDRGEKYAIKHEGLIGNNYSMIHYVIPDINPGVRESKVKLQYDDKDGSILFQEKNGYDYTLKVEDELMVLSGKDEATKVIHEAFELKMKEIAEESRLRAEERARKEEEEKERKIKEAENARIEAEERAKREAEYRKRREEEENYKKYENLSRDLFAYKMIRNGESVGYKEPNEFQKNLGYTTSPTRQFSTNSFMQKGSLDFLIDVIEDCVNSSERRLDIPFEEKEALSSLKAKVSSVCPKERDRFSSKSDSLAQEEYQQKIEESQRFSTDLENVFISFCEFAKTNNIQLETISYRKTYTYEYYENTSEDTYIVPDTFETLCKGVGKYIFNTRGIEACQQFAEKIGSIVETDKANIVPKEEKGQKQEIDD